jgi:hypothetical protein
MATATSETMFPTIIGYVNPLMDTARVALGCFIIAWALRFDSRNGRLPWQRPGVAILVAFLGCILAGWLGGVAWPNSGDEYSYVYLTDTFLAGRLWNPAPPDPVLFETYHVTVHAGRMFSPYPPGWSALLVPFRAIGATWLATPLLTVGMGIALDRACRRLGVTEAIRRPALALVLLAPFTLFLGGSLFPQTMAAALVAGIIWAQLADEAGPRVWRKLLIGALFGILLLTRFDVFAVAALVYGADRLVIRRFGAIIDGTLVLLGVLPFIVCLAAFNAGITGNPFQLTSSWGGADLTATFTEKLSFHYLLKEFISLNLYWLGNLAQFGGLPVLLLSAVGLLVKLRRRTCRFYDFMLPAAILFYSFMPFTGGHQYGARYWFWAWPLSVLTIVTSLTDAAGECWVFRWRFRLESATAAFLICTLGAFCLLLATTGAYISARRAPLDAPAPEARSIVLLPNRMTKLWPWALLSIPADSLDFARNDIDFSGRVLFGRGDVPDAISRACHLTGREVFRWKEPGRLVRENCP